MKKENVVVKKNTSEHLAPSGRGWHEVPGEGVLNKEHFIGTPSSPLRGTSPAGGEVNGGFTLIELLVVVLIIGILAAVAVPQYKKAVKKSKATHVEVILDAAAKAVDMYLLENGLPQSGTVYLTGKDSVSTIDMPGDCSSGGSRCITDVGRFSASCSSSKCQIIGYLSTGTDATWLSSQSTALLLSKTAPGGKWSIDSISKINKNSTDAEQKQAAEVICPILEKYVAEDDENFVANCK